MAINVPKPGVEEMRAALADSRSSFIAVAVFSFFVNLLVFTGPLFMMQIYDRVLGSGSEATLVSLCVLMVALYFIQGVLDHVRGRIAARIGARFQTAFDSRVFRIVLERTMLSAQGINTSSSMKDLDSVQRALSSPAIFTLFDIPWTPIFIFVIFVHHAYLGSFAIAGALILVVLSWLNQSGTQGVQEKAMEASRQSEELTASLQKESDAVRALGMRKFAAERWQAMRDVMLSANMNYSDANGFYSTASKTFRIFLQSAVLAIGAWLVLKNEITAGTMIANSILIGRGLSPIEGVIGHWATLQRAYQGWFGLSDLLGKVPPEPVRTTLPKPKALLQVDQLSAAPPGERVPTLRALTFELNPGQALGVIGQSGSGKTTLARILTGVWPIAAGKVRLDGAPIDQYGADALSDHIGYLPQDVALFEGTIAENIARLDSQPDPEKVVAAAKKAAAHDLILSFPQGYDTRLAASSTRLSGGQRQRIGLARAMYGNPAIVVLDEPNSNLDAEGSAALNLAIRNMKAEGRSVVIMAHRPAAIEECDLILILDGGNKVAFGPRDEVLRAHLRNAQQIVPQNAQTAPSPTVIPANRPTDKTGPAQ